LPLGGTSVTVRAMHTLLHDVSSGELLTALESNMVAFWSPYGRGPDGTVVSNPRLTWFYTGIPSPLFNGVLSVRLDHGDLDAVIDLLKIKIATHGAPALWWIGPLSKPDNIGELLPHHGIVPAGEVPAMAIDLARLETTRAPIANFEIRRVEDVYMRTLWARTAAVGTGFAEKVGDAMVAVESGLSDPEYDAQFRYIGFLDGRPVATSAMVLHGGVAGIYAVATLPAARLRGIGTAMTAIPLLEARGMGFRVGILQASSAGHAVYRALGFEDVSKYVLYLQS
jgi:GNAT superfamily N-acetyltransferase